MKRAEPHRYTPEDIQFMGSQIRNGGSYMKELRAELAEVKAKDYNENYIHQVVGGHQYCNTVWDAVKAVLLKRAAKKAADFLELNELRSLVQ